MDDRTKLMHERINARAGLPPAGRNLSGEWVRDGNFAIYVPAGLEHHTVEVAPGVLQHYLVRPIGQ